MIKCAFVVSQIFLFSSFSYAELTLARPFEFRKALQGVGKVIHSPPSFSGLSLSLFSLPSLSEIASIVREGVIKTQEVEAEAKRRRGEYKSLLRREKTFQERVKERQERIKELKQKIEEARNSLEEAKEGESAEDMLAELYELQNKPIQPELEKNDKKTGFSSLGLELDLLEQPIKSGSYQVPGMRMLPSEEKSVSRSETAVCITNSDGLCQSGDQCPNINRFDRVSLLKHRNKPKPLCSINNEEERFVRELAVREAQRSKEEAERRKVLANFPTLSEIKFPPGGFCKLIFEENLEVTLQNTKAISRLSAVFNALDRTKSRICISFKQHEGDYECQIKCIALATNESVTGQLYAPGIQGYETTTTATQTALAVLALERLACPPYTRQEESRGLANKWVCRLFERNHQLLSGATIAQTPTGPISISEDMARVEAFCRTHNLYNETCDVLVKFSYDEIIEQNGINYALSLMIDQVKRRGRFSNTLVAVIGKALRKQFAQENPDVFQHQAKRLEDNCEGYKLCQSEFDPLNPADPLQLIQLGAIEANALLIYAVNGFNLEFDWHHLALPMLDRTIMNFTCHPLPLELRRDRVVSKYELYRSCFELVACEVALLSQQTIRRAQGDAQGLKILEKSVVCDSSCSSSALRHFLNASFYGRNLDATMLCLGGHLSSEMSQEDMRPFGLLTARQLYETHAEGTDKRFVFALELWDSSGECQERNTDYSTRLSFGEFKELIFNAVERSKIYPSFHVVCDNEMIAEHFAMETAWYTRGLPFSIVPSGLSVCYLQSRWEKTRRASNGINFVTNNATMRGKFSEEVDSVEEPGASSSEPTNRINIVVLCGHSPDVQEQIENISEHQRSGVLILGCCNFDQEFLRKLLGSFTSIVCSAGEPREEDILGIVSETCQNFLVNGFSIAESLMCAKNTLAKRGADSGSYSFYCKGLDVTLPWPTVCELTPFMEPLRAYLTWFQNCERLGHQVKEYRALGGLNDALAALSPPVEPLVPADFVNVRGFSNAFLDSAITQCNEEIYNYIDRDELVTQLINGVVDVITRSRPTFRYDTHGRKHFRGGGPQGTKFTCSKEVVNPQLEELIALHAARIICDAKGQSTNYYLTFTEVVFVGLPNKHGLTIQLTYIPENNTIEYHGYPNDSVKRSALSRTEDGEEI
ncbi:MAG: hypothetical protein I8H75_04465 [Myxococcaceae bacterium]|nr:hypothetical protein [Myxococcaceae bacterium]MBH2006577.1 hypothetical protein [Myxococcaceae bacterium]